MNITEKEKKAHLHGLSSFTLHIMAMAFMLLDHMWATVIPGNEWMTILGRLAFPIFAFMTVEGYYHTKDLKKYLLRLLLFALISEVPFNYLVAFSPIFPFHQNVLWTFLIGLLGIRGMDLLIRKARPLLAFFGCCGIILLGLLLGTVSCADYYGGGVMIVFLFYFFRKNSWSSRLAQLISLYLVSAYLLGGQYYTIKLFGLTLEIYKQVFCCLALIPIWLYDGRQGYHAKWFQYFCYAFYPVHIAILVIIASII